MKNLTQSLSGLRHRSFAGSQDVIRRVRDLYQHLQPKLSDATEKAGQAVLDEVDYPFTYQEIKALIQPASMSLCLLDQNFCLSADDAAVLQDMFGRIQARDKHQASVNFSEIIAPYLMERKNREVTHYLNYLFKPDADLRRIQQKNPLRCFTITALNQDKGSSTNHYEFNFKPLLRDGQVKKVLVSVEDITKAITMEYSLTDLKKKDQSSVEKLSSISSMLQFEKEIIIEFLLSTSSALKLVRRLVEEKNTSLDERNQKLDEIFRIAHQVKGDAAALGFKFLAQETHNFESILDELKFGQCKTANVNDLLSLVDPLKKMIANLVNIRALMNHLGDVEWQQESARDEVREEQKILKKLQALADKIAVESNKKVKLVDDFTQVPIPASLRPCVNDVLLQLTRNALVHGIEEPKIRRQLCKTHYGCVHISAVKNDKNFRLSVRDDGAGINIEKLRQAALASGKFTAEQLAAWQAEDFFKLLKAPGFSTASALSKHAGRGVGLDLIDHQMAKWGGQMQMSSKKNQYTQFTLNFPLAQK